ncbi:MAG: prepilin-type N-terminal cleavage/methylation domain-containing protein [Mariprofundus sp.]|nr:prepilin-type N-terminal cleavage/methylation domain-containing protein [Mariprofundus sp.]
MFVSCYGIADVVKSEAGFTLLEIMLVIVIMAVTAMMVAPSYFSAISVSVDDEGKRLAQVLRLASEEATLSGDTFRVRFRQHSYAFQSAGESGVWQTVQKSPYRQYKLAAGIQLVEIRPSMPLSEQVEKEDKHAEVVLADILLTPEGVSKMVDIILDTEPPGDLPLTIQLRSGPGGIAVKKDDKTK